MSLVSKGEIIHVFFLCSLFIDYVYFILCELLANPLPLCLAAFSNALNTELKRPSS